MLKILALLIDSLFPPRESERIVRTLDAIPVSRHFQPHSFNHHTALTSYQSPTVKALIKENKFHQNRSACRQLAILLQCYATDPTVVFLPIPLGKKRLKERGYNQVTEVLKLAGVLFDENIIIRSTETTPQTHLDRQARLQNMTNVFSVNQPALSTYSNVTFVIVDDVTTTGATLEAARSKLAQCLPSTCSLRCVALAH